MPYRRKHVFLPPFLICHLQKESLIKIKKISHVGFVSTGMESTSVA